jgi:peptidoglycan/xylan/chitin deacetylase (PgdA/CDA1 family)
VSETAKTALGRFFLVRARRVRADAWNRHISQAVLIAAMLLATGNAASAEHEPAALLHALWTERELAGTPADHVVTRPYARPADPSPPVRPWPSARRQPLPEGLRGVIRRVRVDGGDKVLALTFDLCERASNRTGYRTEIVNHLRAHGIRATFFAGGKWMRSHPEQTMQLMADPLFELGNHSWTHANFALLDERETLEQSLWTQSQYEVLREELARRAALAGLEQEMRRVPLSMAVFRLPYGRSSEAALERLAGMGLPVVQWDVLGEGGAGSAREMALRAAREVRPGSIVLMHANAVPKLTQDIVPVFVAELARQGWRFVTVSELLAMGTAESVADGYFEKPGDNVQFDAGYPGKGTLHPVPNTP